MGGLTSGFLSATNGAWRSALAGIRHDFYHLPEYARFAARHMVTGEPVAFLAHQSSERLLVPLMLQPVPTAEANRRVDAVSARGYPGPIASAGVGRPLREEFLEEAIVSLISALRARGVVSAFIRLHPFLSPEAAVLSRHGTIVEHGHSFSIPLDRTDEDFLDRMRPNHRRDIRKAIRAGYIARMDEDWSHLDAFASIYEATMSRLEAAEHWRLSTSYFHDLHEALGDRLHLCVAEIEGRLAAGSIISEVDGIAEYHLSGTTKADASASPSKLIIRFVHEWARARGDRILHLAGSVRAGDSLEHFKVGFSGLRHPVRTWRLVIDPDAYHVLAKAWERRNGLPSDAPAGFFPAYRKFLRVDGPSECHRGLA